MAEIAIERCFIDPGFVRGMCDPTTVTQDDAFKGKWVRVEPDLNQETSMTYLVRLFGRGPQTLRSLVTPIRTYITAALDD